MGDNYDIRDALHNTVNNISSKLLTSYSNILYDSKISAVDGDLESIELSAFQLKIHHFEIRKAIQTFLQISSDLDVGLLLLDHQTRLEEIEKLRSTLQSQINQYISPHSSITRHMLNYSLPTFSSPLSQDNHRDTCTTQKDDDVICEGNSLSLVSFQTNKQAFFPEYIINDPSNIPPTSHSTNLFLYP